MSNHTSYPSRLSLALLGLLALAIASPSSATDGVLEINHVCASSSGCFPGDTAGYPVTINARRGGSYRLTSDLLVPGLDTNGIVVDANDVTIDLNGFTVIRASCYGETEDCTPASGNGHGVTRTSIDTLGMSVRNGSVVGMAGSGIVVGSQAEVANVRVRWNRIHGIQTGFGSIVRGNVARQNGSRGITAFSGSTVTGNSASNNGSDGILISGGSTATNNTSYFNGGDGINCLEGSTVHRNTVYGNTGFGLALDPGASYRENTITDNTAGTVSGGVNTGNNACNGSTICP